MSSRHGGKRVVSLPRDTEGKSADVEAFTRLAAARFSVTLSTHFFLTSTSNPVTGQNVTHKVMAYTIRTFRGYLDVPTYNEAWNIATNQLEDIKSQGFSLAHRWVRIENNSGMVKLVFLRADGSVNETQWLYD